MWGTKLTCLRRVVRKSYTVKSSKSQSSESNKSSKSEIVRVVRVR